ncbi:MAG: amidase domain-containing protein [Clostridia bacterium]|nr:amidase domain-containing protein [Clostridia bacterium]
MLIENIFRKPVAEYDRVKAVEYARKWAMKRNPQYLDFDKYGGDCTNFASQVLFAGSGIMNYKPTYGWYYINANKRTASWTGVNFLYNFLIGNKGSGPFAEEVDVKDVKPGDLVQVSFNGGNHYNHTPVIINTGTTPSVENIRIAAHSDDRENDPLTCYTWKKIRYLHIVGVRRA